MMKYGEIFTGTTGHLMQLQALGNKEQINAQKSGPRCSKLTTSLVNDSLKFTSSDPQICWNFLLNAVQKLLTFSSKKYQNIVNWIH